MSNCKISLLLPHPVFWTFFCSGWVGYSDLSYNKQNNRRGKEPSRFGSTQIWVTPGASFLRTSLLTPCWWALYPWGAPLHASEPWHSTYHCLVGAHFPVFLPHGVSPGTASCSVHPQQVAGTWHSPVLVTGNWGRNPWRKGPKDQVIFEWCLAQNHIPLNVYWWL